jgi:hypothetical protein
MIIKRKRGRPPKNKAVIAQEIVTPKRRRGRPPKNKVALIQEPVAKKRKRGRPPKSQNTPKLKEAKPIVSGAKNDNYVAGKLFTHSKQVSKQEEWFEDWDTKCWKLFCQKDWENLIFLIKDLQGNINKILQKAIDPKLFIHIPIIRLMQDDKILKIAFDPINKGVEVHVFYRTKDFPIGLSPSMKTTAVCNKVTELIKSFVPIGISG